MKASMDTGNKLGVASDLALGAPRATYHRRGVDAAQDDLVSGDPPYLRKPAGNGWWKHRKLKEILGHSTVQITERYAHLKTDLFGAKDLGTIPLDLRPRSPEKGTIGSTLATAEVAPEQKIA
jgi:hypothetical protein